MRKPVVLLNPPSRDGLRYLRDFFCSHISKGAYYWHPYDLLVLSGILHEGGFTVTVVDAIAERLSVPAALKRIEEARPEAVVFLTGTASFTEDMEFTSAVKRQVGAHLIGIGDVLYHRGDKVLEQYSCVDAILMDFSTRDIVGYLDGGAYDRSVVRTRDSISAWRLLKKYASGPYEIPVPRYEMFSLSRYRLPHTKHRHFASVCTSYGCAYTCAFCHACTIPFKLRKVDNVLEELRYVRSLGIREIWFRDFTFASDRMSAVELLTGMIEEGLRFDWVAITRVDCIDEELVGLMRRAGCHTLQLGVESQNEEVMRKYNKGVTNEQIKKGFELCRADGIRTLAHFMLGLPGEDRESMLQTIRWALELDPDYASFNVASPYLGTAIRHQAKRAGVAESELEGARLDNSTPVLTIGDLTPEDILRIRNRANRTFYLRPKYIARMVRNVDSLYRLNTLAAEFTAMTAGLLRG